MLMLGKRKLWYTVGSISEGSSRGLAPCSRGPLHGFSISLTGVTDCNVRSSMVAPSGGSNIHTVQSATFIAPRPAGYKVGGRFLNVVFAVEARHFTSHAVAWCDSCPRLSPRPAVGMSAVVTVWIILC